MNAPHPLQGQLSPTVQAMTLESGDEIDLREYWDIVVDNRLLIALITTVAIALGGAYAFLSRPVYESNLLIQVEDSSGSTKSFLGEAASLFDVKTPASAEIELIRSRLIVGKAVDDTALYVDARPHYVPLIGNWLARRASKLSNPGIFGFKGYVSGTESITVPKFDVPPALENSSFKLTATGKGEFVLSHPKLEQELHGAVNLPMVRSTPLGTVTLIVTELEGLAGAEFEIVRRSRLGTVEGLQANLQIAEKGRQSGVIEVTLQGNDRERMTQVLNEIGKQYVRQNVERKAAEADKTLSFLDVQLPQFKKQLDQSEEAYSRYRNQQGTVALDEEAKLALNRAVDLQGKLLEAQQKRVELISRFTGEHPAVRTLDQQIAVWTREINALNARVKTLPAVQQDAVRLERDVKVNTELYQQLRNNAMQLQLIREGKIGNVRVIDEAIAPEQPIKPRRGMVVSMAALLGLLGGVLAAIARTAFFRGIRSAQEIESGTGLNVYSSVPLSGTQQVLARKVAEKQPGVHVLATVAPQDAAVESLRSLRTALQFAMLGATNNRVLVTGATPGVGKSFLAVNFATILASAGKRVLLIDADLRKGYLNQYFGEERVRGLSEVVAGTLKLAEAIRRQVAPNLDLLTTGVLPPNPAELMTSSAFAQVMEELSDQYDLVILDTPPVLVAADTVGVAPQAGTLLLVARANTTQLGELHESAKRLAHAGKSATGVVFNGIDLNRRHYGAYGYKYGGYRYRHYTYEQQVPTLR